MKPGKIISITETHVQLKWKKQEVDDFIERLETSTIFPKQKTALERKCQKAKIELCKLALKISDYEILKNSKYNSQFVVRCRSCQ